MSTPLLKVNNIVKNFGGIRALKGVSLEVYPQEILALVGENGAGKSTLAKIIAGIITPDEGTMQFEGKTVSFHNPNEAKNCGIAIVLQEFNLIPHLSIAENILLTHPSTYIKKFWLNSKFIHKETMRLLDELKLDFNLDPRTKVIDLSVAEQQIVEILKALSVNAKMLVMDEPTATLTRQEVAKLFTLMNRLRNQGMTIIFVSHRIEEIFQISDRIVVFRDGEKVKDVLKKNISERELISYMVGRDIGDLYSIRQRKEPGEVILEVSNLKWRNRLKDCSFQIRKGEVLGIYGLVGAGRTELLRTIFGAEHPEYGTIVYKNIQGYIRSPLHAIRMNIGMIPEDRKALGVLTDLSICKNITLSYLSGKGSFWISRKKEETVVKEKIKELSIKANSPDAPVSSLSGGNQQKVAIAKWLLTQPELFILDEPTRGIDIGSKFEIYRLIDYLALQGVAIVLVSSELPEILALSDRILIMNNGRFVKELNWKEASEEIVLSYSTQTTSISD